jgi:hypothetical protein
MGAQRLSRAPMNHKAAIRKGDFEVLQRCADVLRVSVRGGK